MFADYQKRDQRNRMYQYYRNSTHRNDGKRITQLNTTEIMKPGYTIKNFGEGLFISVCNYEIPNEIVNYCYSKEYLVRDDNAYRIGIWKLKKLK